MNFLPFGKPHHEDNRQHANQNFSDINRFEHPQGAQTSGTAKATEVINEILLPAFRKPIRPPATSKTI